MPHIEAKPISGDIVEVERNIVEKWLLDAKHYMQANTRTVRLFTLSIAALLVIFLGLLFYYSISIESANKRTFELIQELDQLKYLPQDTQATEEGYRELAVSGEKLCDRFLKTAQTMNGCLIASIAHDKSGDRTKATENLAKYSDYHNYETIGLFTGFYTAQKHEQAGEYDKAMTVYKELQKTLEPVEQEDLAIFHQARILYEQKKYNEAVQLFEKIADNKGGPESVNDPLVKDAVNYIMLIEAARSVQTN